MNKPCYWFWDLSREFGIVAPVSAIPIPPRTGGAEGVAQQQRDQSQTGGAASAPLAEDETEKGMPEMSRVYNEGGRELYFGAGDRERD